MGEFCTHVFRNGECGDEIEGMYEPYCQKHMNQYTCNCNHSYKKHDDGEECTIKSCDCEGFELD